MDNEQKKYEENRFGFYREKSTEELEEKLAEFTTELEEDSKIFETTSNGNKKSEAHEDIKFNIDRINYLEKLLEERKTTKHR